MVLRPHVCMAGMKIHSRGWYSAYADPEKAAFKGSAPLNMTGMPGTLWHGFLAHMLVCSLSLPP